MRMIRLTPKTMWIFICVQCLVLANIAYCDSNTQGETIHIHIGGSALSGNKDCKLQDEISATATIRDKIVQLRLKRNDDINLNAPLFTSSHKNGGLAEERHLLKIEDSAEYQDDVNMAAMTVTCRQSQDQNIDLTLHGLFTFEGTVYSLQKSRRLRRSDTSIHDEYNMVQERIHSNTNDYIAPPELREIPENNKYTPLKTAKTGQRYKRQTTRYYIDVLALIDYSIYKRWYDTSSQTSSILKENETLQNIRRYYAYIMNGVNLRYKSIKTLNNELNIRLVGYYVAKGSWEAPWTENYRQNGTRGFQVDANRVLSYLQQWTTRQTLPNNDHVMAFTGYDLFSVINGRESTATSGLAYISTLCSTFGHSTSLVEDLGGFQCVDTAAHELGHSLGAKHDGDGNNCNPGDRFIMSGGTYKVTSTNTKNPWAFSDCSINYFRDFLTTLSQTRNGIECLTEIARSSNVPDVSSIMPGQVYNTDEQCQMVHGSSSRRCQGPEFGSYDNICTRLFCLDTKSNSTSCWQHTAARGTSCGNKKWCIGGECRYAADAPSADDDCVFGDQSGISFDGQTCLDFTAGENAAYCYQAVVGHRCCASCRRHFTGIQGCEYGDSLKGCDPRYCDYEYADGKRYADNCCMTCNQFTTRPTTTRGTTPPTAPPTTTTPRVITTTTVPGSCDRNYGDTLNVRFNGQTCEEYISSDPALCYTESAQKYCCYSCKIRQNGVPGCQYGDAFTCYRSLCDYVYDDGTPYSSYCCDTCNQPETTTTTLPTTTPSTTTPQTTTTPSTTTPPTTTPSTTTTMSTTTAESCQDTIIYGVTCSAYLRAYGRGRCYNSDVVTACCRSCQDTASSIEGCRYGDRVNPCYESACYITFENKVAYRDVCCETCRGVPDTTTSATTPSTTVFTTATRATTTTSKITTTTPSTTPRRITPTTTTTPSTTTIPTTISTTTRRTTPVTTTTTPPTTTTTVPSTTSRRTTPVRTTKPSTTTAPNTLPTESTTTQRASSTTTSNFQTTAGSIPTVTSNQTESTTAVCADRSNNCLPSIRERGRVVCYLSTFEGACCETCTAVRNVGTACSYGDKNPSLCAGLRPPLQLTCQGLEGTCCDTCKDFVTTGADIHSRSTLLVVAALLLMAVFAL